MHRPKLPRLAACIIALYAGACLAATEVNQAGEAELDGLAGIGPALSGRILRERERAPYRDWGDLMRRVPGIKAASAARLSAAGLTVNGTPYAAPAAAPSKAR